MRILIADDDRVTRKFLGDVMSRVFGFEVHEASTIAEAVKLVSSGDWAMMLVDRNFPDGDINDFCAALKKCRPSAMKVPKWLVTGEKPASWKPAEWKPYGVAGYITKPCLIDDLSAAVSKSLPGRARAC